MSKVLLADCSLLYNIEKEQSDIKRKTSKEILVDSFRELADQKQIDKITIKEITDNCGYSPATFYRQFKDKYDLIAWDYVCRLDDLKSIFDGSEQSWKLLMNELALFFQKERIYMSNLFLHTSGLDAFILYMQERKYEAIIEAIIQKCKKKSKKIDMLVRTYVFGTVQFTCEWILGRINADVNTVAEVYVESLPESIRYLLFHS